MFLTPALLFFSICVLFPLGHSVWMSLHAWDGSQTLSGEPDVSWVGFGNYIELASDRRFHTSIMNNFLWLVLFMLAMPIGLAFALFLNQNVFGIRIARSLFFFPFVLSQVIVGFVFSWLYDPRNGLIGQLWQLIERRAPAILGDPDLVNYGLIAAGLWPQIAYCGLIYLTGLTTLSQDQIEAARLDGAKRWRMLWYVILPQLRGATFIAFIVTTMGALRAFDLVAVMTGGGPFGSSRILSYFMFEQALSEYGVRKGYGSAIATVLFVLTFIFLSIFLWRHYRSEKGES